MRAYIINPAERTIVQTDIRKGESYQTIKAVVGSPFDAVRVSDAGDTLYIDDEGLLKPDLATFRLESYPYPLVGTALLIGSDDEGEDADATLEPQDVARLVIWDDRVTTGELTAGRDATPEELRQYERERGFPEGTFGYLYIGGQGILKEAGR